MVPYAVALTAALTMMSAPLVPAAHAAATHQQLRPSLTTSAESCYFRKTEYATANAFDESTSENFVNLRDGGLITFTQAGTGCVGGTFFANAIAATGDHIGLQVLLDGIACSPLTNGYIFADDRESSSHSAAFFCGVHIAPGKHRIQVQFHSGFGGNVQFFQRTLEVHHT